MKPTDFLSLAESLAIAQDEASKRTAASRAYYAAYHHCLEWHGQLPVPGSNSGPSGGVHQVLINQLSNPAPELEPVVKALSRRTGIRLNVIRTTRKKADYSLHAPMEELELCQALSTARLLFSECV